MFRALDAVLQELDAGQHLVLVTAQAGEGKTVLLHRLAYLLAQRHNQDQVTARQIFGEADFAVGEDDWITSVADELEVVPSLPMPVFMDLRMAFSAQAEFERALLALLRKLSAKDSLQSIEQLFKIHGSRWILLLDGIDEIRNRLEAGAILRTWVESLPSNVQVVIASRPYAAQGFVGAKVELAPLEPDEILYLLEGKILREEIEGGTQIATRIESLIRSNPEIQPILTRQRAIDGLIKAVAPQSINGFIAEIDRDQVTIAEPQNITPFVEGQGEIPVISPESLQGDGYLEGSDNSEPEAHEDSWLALPLALALQSITEHLQQEEKKRQQDWGADPEQALDRASYDLGRVAWHTDWAEDSFDPMKCENDGWLHPETLRWNEDIGFVEREQARLYRFFCTILRRYMAAKHCYDERNDDQAVDQILLQDLDRPATIMVLRLLNELRQANGYKRL